MEEQEVQKEKSGIWDKIKTIFIFAAGKMDE